ncbi:hypothetical protein HMPREF0059_01264 [Actinomyces viscosus C505]|uniref:Uncharacterized protein n=1 Tax=Actinomyces viscosus C505 TaxID=562973 RepID=F2UWS4_ACTVI|nr:hypothetical protein [Actinomyces viscosus]EGE38408.2 hypothetical protein HMPREF0059_01264 [Actinomyces viscosus C505]
MPLLDLLEASGELDDEKYIISARGAAVGCVSISILGMDVIDGSEFIKRCGEVGRTPGCWGLPFIEAQMTYLAAADEPLEILGRYRFKLGEREIDLAKAIEGTASACPL